MRETISINIEAVKYREDLYPRANHDQERAQQYAKSLDLLPPIEVNQDMILIDGYHRWTAHRLEQRETINAQVTETSSDAHLLELAIERNAAHGLQMSQADKKRMAIKLYATGERSADRKVFLAKLLSVDVRSVRDWVSDLDKAEREERDRKIKDLWQRCYSNEEIAEQVGVSVDVVKLALSGISEDLPKNLKVSFSEEDWQPPLYNVWAFGKKTNATTHFGNTEARIVDNLVYLFTEPDDIVVDPFGGGGATLDVCRKRGRRCWISDRAPKPGLENVLRTLDINKELPPLHKRWSDVTLTYLDPPYWKQAEGEYSDSPEDFANMPLEEFTESMVGVVRRIAQKQSRGAIALVIQPTQWRAPDRQFTDHVLDICKGVEKSKNLSVWNRIQAPYSTQQCTPQMSDWAKDNRQLLVLSREVIVWRVS